MRIGVDAACWSNLRGYGRFTRALLTATLSLDQKNQYVFFIDHDPTEYPLPAGVEVVRVAAARPAVQAASADGRRSLKDVWAMSRAIGGENLDLVFFPSVYTYVPLLTGVPKLVTIHDAIPELHPELVFPSWQSKILWRAKVWLGCAQAKLILTVSDYSARCLAEQFKLPPARLRVVNEASDPVFRPLETRGGSVLSSRCELPDTARILVYVGGFSPHKNLSFLVDVFRELQAQTQFNDLRLVLVGDHEGDAFYSCYKLLVDQVEQAGLRERVCFTGRVSDADLVAVLNRAEVLVLPSFSEGFGLPAVEAAACGTPAVVTTASPLPGLLGEGVIAIAPGDRAGWIRALAGVLGDKALRKRMGQAGLQAALRLSWNNSAQQLLAVFEEVVEVSATA